MSRNETFIKILRARENLDRNGNDLREKGWKIDACLLTELLFLCSTCCDDKLGEHVSLNHLRLKHFFSQSSNRRRQILLINCRCQVVTISNHVQSHRANGFESRVKRDTARKLKIRVKDNEKLQVKNRKQKTFQVFVCLSPEANWLSFVSWYLSSFFWQVV